MNWEDLDKLITNWSVALVGLLGAIFPFTLAYLRLRQKGIQLHDAAEVQKYDKLVKRLNDMLDTAQEREASSKRNEEDCLARANELAIKNAALEKEVEQLQARVLHLESLVEKPKSRRSKRS